MSIDLTSSMNRLTDLYLDPDSYSKSIENSIGSSLKTGEEAKEKFGPVSLKAGNNTLYIEFENSEIMAVIPVFTMEVSNEKQSD